MVGHRARLLRQLRCLTASPLRSQQPPSLYVEPTREGRLFAYGPGSSSSVRAVTFPSTR